MVKIIYCYTCKREFNKHGIARHRAMHRDKKEDCKIMFSKGNIESYNFNDKGGKR